jgi:hypothetical protein
MNELLVGLLYLDYLAVAIQAIFLTKLKTRDLSDIIFFV